MSVWRVVNVLMLNHSGTEYSVGPAGNAVRRAQNFDGWQGGPTSNATVVVESLICAERLAVCEHVLSDPRHAHHLLVLRDVSVPLIDHIGTAYTACQQMAVPQHPATPQLICPRPVPVSHPLVRRHLLAAMTMSKI